MVIIISYPTSMSLWINLSYFILYKQKIDVYSYLFDIGWYNGQLPNCNEVFFFILFPFIHGKGREWKLVDRGWGKEECLIHLAHKLSAALNCISVNSNVILCHAKIVSISNFSGSLYSSSGKCNVWLFTQLFILV